MPSFGASGRLCFVIMVFSGYLHICFVQMIGTIISYGITNSKVNIRLTNIKYILVCAEAAAESTNAATPSRAFSTYKMHFDVRG